MRYVLAENRVTAFAFGLFVLIVLAALIGPYHRSLRSAGQQHGVGAEAALGRRTGSAPTSSAATC